MVGTSGALGNFIDGRRENLGKRESRSDHSVITAADTVDKTSVINRRVGYTARAHNFSLLQSEFLGRMQGDGVPFLFSKNIF